MILVWQEINDEKSYENFVFFYINLHSIWLVIKVLKALEYEEILIFVHRTMFGMGNTCIATF